MDLILHHYDFSNFSEKVRLVLGLKDLEWFSVEIPAYPPKPDYIPLTGGYRRTPALQIGADVYCDTALIVKVLDSIKPQAPLYPGPDPVRAQALCETLAAWAESQLLWPVALYVSGFNARRFPEVFHRDRAELHGKPAPTIEQVEASAPKYRAQMWPQLERIEDLLSAGNDYVLGDAVSLADIVIYEAPWFLDTMGGHCEGLDRLPTTRTWMERVRSLGHGRPIDLSAQAALDRARAAEPLAIDKLDYQAPEGVAVGEEVIVEPLGERSPASGILAFIDERRVSIRVSNDRVDEVCVHFPRLGYRVRRRKR